MAIVDLTGRDPKTVHRNAKGELKLTYRNLEGFLSPEGEKVWAAYQAAAAKAKEAKERLDVLAADMVDDMSIGEGDEASHLLPDDYVTVLGLNFGRFSFAMVPATAVRTRKAKTTETITMAKPKTVAQPAKDVTPELPKALKRSNK